MMPERRPTRLQSTILPGQGTEDDKDFETPQHAIDRSARQAGKRSRIRG
jgi:hypothetical protein